MLMAIKGSVVVSPFSLYFDSFKQVLCLLSAVVIVVTFEA